MPGLLQSELEPWRWLDVCGAAEVLDAFPRDRFKPLEVHDLFVQSESLFTTKQALVVISRSCSGGLIRAGREGEENL